MYNNHISDWPLSTGCDIRPKAFPGAVPGSDNTNIMQIPSYNSPWPNIHVENTFSFTNEETFKLLNGYLGNYLFKLYS